VAVRSQGEEAKMHRRRWLRAATAFAVGTLVSLGGVASAATRTVAVAGDISKDTTSLGSTGADNTATMINAFGPNQAWALGDTQYVDGSTAEYSAYWQQSWNWGPIQTSLGNGFKAAIGNHEWQTPGGAGWEAQFGRNRHYYTFTVNTGGTDASLDWRVYVLDSTDCNGVGGDCSDGDGQQYDWLQDEIATNTATECVAAFWHHPIWTGSTVHTDTTDEAEMAEMYDLLDLSAGADLILWGHDHNYQRYPKQTSAGVQQNDAPKTFIVGTGGADPYSVPNSPNGLQYSDANSYGILELTLDQTSFDYKFDAETGSDDPSSGTTNTSCTNDPV
jgi:hypothetical protein